MKGTSQIFRIAWLGGARPEWTRLAANFEAISFQDVECDEWPSHLPWGKTLDYKDKGVYATSTQPEYPRKMCVALVQCVLRQLQRQGMTFFCAILSKILTATSGLKNQARRAKVPPIIPDTRCSFLCSGVR